MCDNDDQGKAALLSAMSTLVRPQVPEDLQSESVVENDTAEAKPTVLWRALYVQELVKVWNVIMSLTNFNHGNVISLTQILIWIRVNLEVVSVPRLVRMEI